MNNLCDGALLQFQSVLNGAALGLTALSGYVGSFSQNMPLDEALATGTNFPFTDDQFTSMAKVCHRSQINNLFLLPFFS
jgi:hypothetical protein